MEEDLKAAREDLEDRFRRADAAESEGRYLDALSALRPIAPSDHEALQVYHQKAQQRIEQLNALRVAGEEAQIEALARAQELAEQRKYESALATIDSILPGLRSEEMQQLGRELQAILGEIRQLTREVRSALKQKQILTVAGQVDRLWELTPDDPSVTKLKEKLDEHLMTVAARDAQRKLKLTRERLQQGNYRAARELVHTIPEEFRTGDTKKFCQQVVELGWMWEQLRSSPAATPQLARIASRLQSARPDDARIRELAEKLNTRLRTPRPSRTWARNWARSADVGPLQREVRWWTGWDGPTADAVDCQLLERQPGRFLVAFGLAVQGLGRATLPLNLQPLDRRAPWLGLGRPLSRKLRTASPVWGVDLGRSGLKAVRLSVDRKTQQIRLEDLAFLPHDDLLTTNTPLESIRTINSETVARFLREKKLRGPKIVLGLPGYRSLGRFFVVPSADPGKVNDAISYELKAQIPIPAEDLALAQHVVADEGADVKSTRVMLVAARAEHLKLQRQPFETQRCEVLSVQSNFLALYNAASQSLWDQPD